MGPFQLQAYGPDGRCVPTGEYREVIGGLIFLAVGGTRVVRETPEEILWLLQDEEKSY